MRNKQLISKLLLLGMCTSICAGVTTTIPVVNSYAATAQTYVANSGWYSDINTGEEKVDINNLTFTKTSDNTAALSKVSNSITDLVIPEKINVDGKDFVITSLSNNASSDNKNLKTVSFPATITKIGNWAFSDNQSLTTVKFDPNINLKEIPLGAFAKCVALQSFDIPKTVERIRGFAFNECNSFDTIKIPYNVNSIDSFAFIKSQQSTKPLTVIIGGKIENVGVLSFSSQNANINVLVKGIPVKTPGGSNLIDIARLVNAGSGVNSSEDNCKVKIKPILDEKYYYDSDNFADVSTYCLSNEANCDETKYEGELLSVFLSEANDNFINKLIKSYSERHELEGWKINN